jgi:hypothetical protein
MASSMIHLVVANELNKKLGKDHSKFLIGSIAPDLSKLVGDNKVKSHFLDNDSTDIPNLDKFLNKYSYFLNDDFVLGYYVHLFTDYLWFKYFINDIYNEEKNLIYKLNGDVVNCHGEMAVMYIYNDYTNLNLDLINEYDMDLKIFYQPLPEFKNIIDEIPMDKINLIVNKAGIIVENAKKYKEFTFNMENIRNFVNLCVDIISSNLEEIGILKD